MAIKSPTRDAELTRGSILDAAEQEFSRVGLRGARTESIAARTGVTKAMIHYYFENKENLYRAVLDRLIQKRTQDMEALHLEQMSPREALKALVQNYLSHVLQNPNVSNLMLLEALQNEGRFYKESSVGDLYGTLIATLRRGMESGEFVSGDPTHMAINIVGMVVFYVSARDNLQSLFPDGVDIMSEQITEQHIKTCMAMVENAVFSR
jgi:TetR/AcrR family transcriptional regulator